MNEVFIIGICGGTCSGKTTLARSLSDSLGEHAVYISQDAYYKDQSHKSTEEIKQHNFDDPEEIDLRRLSLDLRKLKNSEPADIPRYCFKTHSRLDITEAVQPSRFIILEGILIFTLEELRGLIDIKVFLDVEPDVRLVRRIRRDCTERGRDIGSVIDQYMHSVKPMHEKYVQRQVDWADVLLMEDSVEDQQKRVEFALRERL